jgi:hypothetical protein
MGAQGTVGFSGDAIGQAGIANHDDWRQIVGPGAQRTALGRGEGQGAWRGGL